MGTMRWQKDRAEREKQNRLKPEFAHQNIAIVDEIAELGARLQKLTLALIAYLANGAGEDAVRLGIQIREPSEELSSPIPAQLNNGNAPIYKAI